MELYDAGMYIGQPVQPMKRIYFVGNGEVNTATSWSHDNCTLNAPADRAMFAWRKMARVVAGLEKSDGGDVPAHLWKIPRGYVGLPYDMVAIDLEGDAFTDPVDLTVDALSRAAAIDVYAQRLRAFKDELRYYGRDIPVGLYMPIGALNGRKGLHPADPLYPGYMAQSERDWAPWYKQADFLIPDFSVHSGAFEEWWNGHDSGVSGVDPAISRLRATYPGLPIIAELQPNYAHFTERSRTPEKKWQILELEYWGRIIGQLAGDARLSGICIWGSPPETLLPAGTDRTTHGDPNNGSRRVPWSYVSSHYVVARRICQPKPKARGALA